MTAPVLYAVASAVSLADFALCIALGHTDWPVPAAVAFLLACCVTPGEAAR